MSDHADVIFLAGWFCGILTGVSIGLLIGAGRMTWLPAGCVVALIIVLCALAFEAGRWQR